MDFIKIKYQLVFTLQEKMFIAIKKNHCNNIRVIVIVDTRCCNKI